MNPCRVVVPLLFLCILSSLAMAQTPIGGNLPSTLGLAESPYLAKSDLLVNVEGSCMIEPGVEILFEPDVGLFVEGYLYVAYDGPRGDQEVVFRSAEPMPQPGDWKGIRMGGHGSANISNLSVQHAKIGLSGSTVNGVVWNGGMISECFGTGVELNSAGCFFSNMTVEFNGGDGFSLNTSYGPMLENLTVSHNEGWAFRLNQYIGDLPASLIGQGNDHDGILVSGWLGGYPPIDFEQLFEGNESLPIFDDEWHWESTTLPVVVKDFMVEMPDHLTIWPGSVIKMLNEMSLFNLNYGSRLTTPPADPDKDITDKQVWFTSFKDDFLGGDTNGDGDETEPQRGDWGQVYASHASLDLHNTWFANGGGGRGMASFFAMGDTNRISWIGGGADHSGGDGASFECSFLHLTGLNFDVNGGRGLNVQSYSSFSDTTGSPIYIHDCKFRKNGGNGARITSDMIVPDIGGLHFEENASNPLVINGALGDIPGTITGFGNRRNAISVDGYLGGMYYTSRDKSRDVITPITDGPGRYVWSGVNMPLEVGRVEFAYACSLDVMAGSVLKFDEYMGSLYLNGENVLRAGEPGGEPVWFTSIYDDAHGGDTDGQGNMIAPYPGDWSGVTAYDSKVELYNTWFAYGGSDGYYYEASGKGSGKQFGSQLTLEGMEMGGELTWIGGGALHGNYGGVHTNHVRVEMRDLLLEDNGGSGADLHAFDYGPIVSGVTCRGNKGRGMLITNYMVDKGDDGRPEFNRPIPKDSDMYFDLVPQLSDLTLVDNEGPALIVDGVIGDLPATITGSGNETDCIYVWGYLLPTEQEEMPPPDTDDPRVWSGVDLPILVSRVMVEPSTHLLVEAGSNVKFLGEDSYMEFTSDSTKLETPGGAPVWFTSVNDDAHGGETVWEGQRSDPSPGDWSGLRFNNSVVELADTWIAYGGSDRETGQFHAYGDGNSITWMGGGSIYSGTSGASIEAYSFSAVAVQFSRNAMYGVEMWPDGPAHSFLVCDFADNEGGGLYNHMGEMMIDASLCWWDDANGPHDPSDGPPSININPDGAYVSDWVSYMPWATVPAANGAPNDFSLLEPDDWNPMPDKVYYSGNVTCTWETAVDPNGDPVVYKLQLASDPHFDECYLEFEGLTETELIIPLRDMIEGFSFWRVIANDGKLGVTESGPHPYAIWRDVNAGVDDESSYAFSVSRTWPNPSSGQASLAFTLPRDQKVRLAVYDLRGREVRVLMDGQQAAGPHTAVWDGRGKAGNPVAGGMYFLRLDAESGQQVRKVSLMR